MATGTPLPPWLAGLPPGIAIAPGLVTPPPPIVHGPTGLPYDLLLVFENLFDAVSSYLTVTILPWVSKDPATDLADYRDAIITALRTIGRNMVYYFGADAVAAEQAVRSVVENIVGPLATDASGYWNAALTDIFAGYDQSLKDNATVDPAAVVAVAVSALDEASVLGLGAFIVTAAFELVLPKSLNVMNWLGPILANFSGFDEIIKQWREPQLRAAIGRLSEYNANTQFRTAAPGHADAEQMYARRLISADQLNKLISWSGLMTEFAAPMLETAYQPVSPRLLARAAAIGAIPQADLIDLLQFAEYRDVDIARLVTAFEALALAPYQQTAMQAAKRSFERGLMTAAEFDSYLDLLKIPAEAKPIIMLNSALWKEEQLAELYRKSISEAYKYGQVTDAQYVPALEAIGIGSADAEAHYAIDSIALRGRTALAAARAQTRLEALRTKTATAAAVASYRTGAFDEVALAAALIAAGVDPEVAAFIVTVQTERRAGPLVFVYGRELSHKDALVLKETVAAIEAQYKKQLIDDATAANALAQNNIPDANAKALLATWAALKTKPTTTGEQLPR